MDPSRLDALARSLAVPRSRRETLKAVTGGAIAPLLARAGLVATAPSPRPLFPSPSTSTSTWPTAAIAETFPGAAAEATVLPILETDFDNPAFSPTGSDWARAV